MGKSLLKSNLFINYIVEVCGFIAGFSLCLDYCQSKTKNYFYCNNTLKCIHTYMIKLTCNTNYIE